jgi:hypothetical protein
MPRTPVSWVLTLVLVGAAGCRVTAPPTPSPPTPSPRTLPTASGLASAMPALPVDFPIMPGAVAEDPLEGGPDLIAGWTTGAAGPRVYDFYMSSLPAAGYPIEGLYPGGSVAIIRCRAPDGAIWQVVITGDEASLGTHIQLRLDRP